MFRKVSSKVWLDDTTTQWEMLQHAKRKAQQIAVAWLDLENAYGSVSHMLVQFALKWFYIPQSVSELVFKYYDSIFLKVVTDEWSSEYFHLGIGVPHGYMEMGFSRCKSSLL